MVKLSPSQQAWKFAKMYKNLKKLKITFKKQKPYIKKPKALLARIIATDSKNGKPDSPWLYAAKVAYLMHRFHIPYRIYIGKFQDAGKKMPSIEEIQKMARKEEADCVWIEAEGNIYAAYGKNIKQMHKHYPLYAIGSLTTDSGRINRLAAKFYVNTEETPQVVKGVIPDVEVPDIPNEKPIDLRAEPDEEEEIAESKKGGQNMISAKYFTHQNSTAGKASMDEALFMSKGAYMDRITGTAIIVIGEDYDFSRCVEEMSEGWFSNQLNDLKMSIKRFINRRAKPFIKKASGGDPDQEEIQTNLMKVQSENKQKRKKVSDFILALFSTENNGKREFNAGTEELASAILVMVNNSENIKFVKSGDRMLITMDPEAMSQFQNMRFMINGTMTRFVDKRMYDVDGKKIRADYHKGMLLIRGIPDSMRNLSNVA